MDLKNWYDRVREQLDRLDFPALWAGFAPCPFALYTHDTAVLNGEMMPRPAEFYGNTSVCRQGEHLAVCGYDPMQLRAQDGLLWSGSFLALWQADGTVRRLFGPCAVQLADDPHRATALFVPRM